MYLGGFFFPPPPPRLLYECTVGRSLRVLSAEAEIVLPDLPNSQYQAKSKAISFFAELVKFSATFSISTKTAKPSQSILVPRDFLVCQPYFCHYSVQLASFVPISQVHSKFAQCYNQLQKYLKHWTVFWYKWPFRDLVLVIPPPPLIEVASNTTPYSKLGGTTLNGREEGAWYYISQTCD